MTAAGDISTVTGPLDATPPRKLMSPLVACMPPSMSPLLVVTEKVVADEPAIAPVRIS